MQKLRRCSDLLGITEPVDGRHRTGDCWPHLISVLSTGEEVCTVHMDTQFHLLHLCSVRASVRAFQRNRIDFMDMKRFIVKNLFTQFKRL